MTYLSFPPPRSAPPRSAPPPRSAGHLGAGGRRHTGRPIRTLAAAVVTALAAATLVMLGTGTAAAATSHCAGFSDVSASNSHCHDISWFVSTGVTNGYPDGTFRAGKAVSRGTMAAFFYRLRHDGGQAPACTGKPFRDVAAHSPLCGAIAWLAISGVTAGYTDGTFRPAKSVSRGAMAAFLRRFAGPNTKPRACAAPLFKDVNPGTTFCGAIAWLAYHGIAHGLTASTVYRPTTALSRGMMATFLHRVAASKQLGVRPRAYSAFDAIFVRLVSHARTSRGISAIHSAGPIAAVANYWTNKLAHGATGGKLQHNPHFFSMLRDAEPALMAGAENVARFTAGRLGPQAVMSAYMHSPPHRKNILNPAYHYIGLRTAASGGVAFNTMNFGDAIGRTPRAA